MSTQIDSEKLDALCFLFGCENSDTVYQAAKSLHDIVAAVVRDEITPEEGKVKFTEWWKSRDF